MLMDGKHTVEIFGRNVRDAARDIAQIHPTPDSLRTAWLLFTKEEDSALDDLQGMMWPCLFTEALKNFYRGKNMKVDAISANIGFEDNYLKLSFVVQ